MHSLISYSGVTIVEVVSGKSLLSGTAAAHLQYNLSSRRIFARHRTKIYSPRDLLYLDEKCTPNKSTSRTVEEKKCLDPQQYYLVIIF